MVIFKMAAEFRNSGKDVSVIVLILFKALIDFGPKLFKILK